jgi:hypothetical protein
MQRALIQYRNPKNHDLVIEALRKAERTDLIGFDKKCLIRPRIIKSGSPNTGSQTPHAGKQAPSNRSQTPHAGKQAPRNGSQTPRAASQTPRTGSAALTGKKQPVLTQGKTGASAAHTKKKKTIRNVHKKTR